MIALAQRRANQRFEVEAPVMVEDFRTGFYYNGTLYNYSTGGGYFESRYAPRPGRKIHIKVESLPEVFTPHVYLAEVRWRKPLPENPGAYAYGVGIRYC